MLNWEGNSPHCVHKCLLFQWEVADLYALDPTTLISAARWHADYLPLQQKHSKRIPLHSPHPAR